MSGAKHEAALILRREGWTDAQLAEAFSVCKPTIRYWRREHGIARKYHYDKIDDARALELYRAGAKDSEIARAFGTTDHGAYEWRKRNGLSRNSEPRRGLSPEDRSKAKALLRQGASMKQVAEHFGRTGTAFVAVLRRGMRGEKGLRKPGLSVQDARLRASRMDPRQLMNFIKRAVGRNAPAHITEDAAADLCEAVLDGRVPINEIEEQAPRYVSRVFRQFASKYDSVSIDERNSDGLSLGDRLVDDAAEAAVLMAGARAFEEA